MSWSVTAITAAHQAIIDLVDGGTGAGSLAIRDSADVLLVTIPLTEPCGTIDGAGKLSLTAANAEDNAVASGTADYAELCNGDSVVYATITCQQGTEPVDNRCVLSDLTIVESEPVNFVSAEVM